MFYGTQKILKKTSIKRLFGLIFYLILWTYFWLALNNKMNKNKIGYARVSTLDQSLEIQIEKLKKQGCIKIFPKKQVEKSR